MPLRKPLQEELNTFHAEICAALADTTRIAILYELADGPRSVGELVTAVDSPQATVSRHLKVLRDRQIATSERDGVHMIYTLADPRIIHALDLLREVMRGILTRRAALAQAIEMESA
jgi:ArsR family transcriptional regulator